MKIPKAGSWNTHFALFPYYSRGVFIVTQQHGTNSLYSLSDGCSNLSHVIETYLSEILISTPEVW
jgi:hypothetical protein